MSNITVIVGVNLFVAVLFLWWLVRYVIRSVNSVNKKYVRIFEELLSEYPDILQIKKRLFGMPPYLSFNVGDVCGRFETRQQFHVVAKFPIPMSFRLFVAPNSPLYTAFGLKRLKGDPELDQHYRLYTDNPGLVRQQLAGELRQTLIDGKEYLGALNVGRRRLGIRFLLTMKQLRKDFWKQIKNPVQSIDENDVKESVRWTIEIIKQLSAGSLYRSGS